jgi:hypothetical protein
LSMTRLLWVSTSKTNRAGLKSLFKSKKEKKSPGLSNTGSIRLHQNSPSSLTHQWRKDSSGWPSTTQCLTCQKVSLVRDITKLLSRRNKRCKNCTSKTTAKEDTITGTTILGNKLKNFQLVQKNGKNANWLVLNSINVKLGWCLQMVAG